MEFSRDRISMRQATIFFIMALGAPSLRIIPNYVARDAERAGWLSAIIELVPALLLVWILATLFKRDEGSLYDIYEKVFGKVINKCLTVVYIVWSLCLTGLYLRMFGERFLETILFESNLFAIMAFMAVFIYFLVNQKIDVIGRICEILIYFLMGIVLVVFFTILSQIDLKNIWPVTHYDILPALKGVIPLMTLSSYITAVMFLGDKISDVRNIKKTGTAVMIGWSIFAIILILSTIGVFGHRLNEQLLFPYFATLKNIRILDAVERVESLFISVWVGADVVIITLFSLITLNLIRRLFNKQSHKKFSLWVIAAAFIIAIIFAPNAYEAETVARIYAAPINLILFTLVPFLAVIVGKIRKVI